MAGRVQDFIDQMMPYAVAVGDQYGIDPVTIITQAAIETGWGDEVAGNNYFGIKSHGRPGGQMVNTHEEINGQMVPVKDSFRVYDNLGDSVADYGAFLQANPRYADVFNQQGYQNQLKSIVDSGYATDSNYQNLADNVSSMIARRMTPLPPGSIPNPPGSQVASLLDTAPPRTAPNPMNQSNALRQERGLISSTAPDALKSALARLASTAAREKQAPVPADEWDRVTARNKAMGVISKSGTPTMLPAIAPPGGSQVVYRDITPLQEMKYLYQNGGPTRPGMNVQPLGNTAGFSTGPLGGYPGGPSAAQPAGSVNLFKPQEQLAAGSYLPEPGSGSLSPIQQLAALYAQGGPTRPGMPTSPFPMMQSGDMALMRNPAMNPLLGGGGVAPVPFSRPTGLGVPSTGRPPLEITVSGSNTIRPPVQRPPQQISVVQALRNQGLTPAQAYALANANNTPRTAADRDEGYDGPGHIGLTGP